LGGTIDQLLEADVMLEIFCLVRRAGIACHCFGVLVESLSGFEGCETLAELRRAPPVLTLGYRNCLT
jgi:hypothetical protein